MREPHAFVVVQNALTGLERSIIQTRWDRQNPHYAGAPVADILDLIGDADGAIQWTDPYFEQHGVGETLDNVCVLAAAVLLQRVPSVEAVTDLRQRCEPQVIGGKD